MYGNFVEKCGLNATNDTATLGFYEGKLPANGEAVQVLTVQLNDTGVSDAKKKTGGNKGNSTNTSGATPRTSAAFGMQWMAAAVTVAFGAAML
jgi:hypothetical protein